jgi:hypothetical protein
MGGNAIDYITIYVKTVTKHGEWKDNFGDIKSVLTPYYKKPRSSPLKKKRSARRCIWRYRFKAGVWNCQILKQVVEPQLFTSLWNTYKHWLSDIELIQMSAFARLLFQDWSLFHCWKVNWGLIGLGAVFVICVKDRWQRTTSWPLANTYMIHRWRKEDWCSRSVPTW